MSFHRLDKNSMDDVHRVLRFHNAKHECAMTEMRAKVILCFFLGVTLGVVGCLTYFTIFADRSLPYGIQGDPVSPALRGLSGHETKEAPVSNPITKTGHPEG